MRAGRWRLPYAEHFVEVDVSSVRGYAESKLEVLTRRRFWSTSMAQAVMIVAAFFVFRETYGPKILEQRAKQLRQSTGRYFYTATAREHGGRSLVKILQRSLSRPIRLLLFHPIIQINGLLSAFQYGVLYIILSTYSTVWTDIYH